MTPLVAIDEDGQECVLLGFAANVHGVGGAYALVAYGLRLRAVPLDDLTLARAPRNQLYHSVPAAYLTGTER